MSQCLPPRPLRPRLVCLPVFCAPQPRRLPCRPLLLAALLAAHGLAQAQTISQIQGIGHLSPLSNTQVSGVQGIVTAVSGLGFWFQGADDGDPRSSDAMFVFRGSSGSKPQVGDEVLVSGRVQEFRPGGDANNLTITQINASSGLSGAFTVLGSGKALPAARVIDAGFLPPSLIAPDLGPAGNVESPGHVLNPALYSMDFYESLEGMRVAMPAARVVGATNQFGEVSLVAQAQVGNAGSAWTPRGGVALSPGQFNGQRLFIDDVISATPVVNVGAQLGNVTGVMDYSFNNYKLYLTQPASVIANGLQKESAVIGPGRLGIGSYNVENLAATTSAARIDAVAAQIAFNLGAPQIVALQEMQDNNGTVNNGVVAADLTLDRLRDAVNAATGRSYAWVNVDPANNADGGAPGGNIRNAFLYDTARVSFAGAVGGALDAVSASNVGGQIALNFGAGRVDPGNPAFVDSRKPLVSEFSVDGQQIILINNHFNSKGGDQPLYGPNQPPEAVTEAQRLAQAQVVGSFVQGLLAINPHANIIVMGDLNDFQFAGTLEPLAAAGLLNLTDTLPEDDRYTYNFQGNSQALDHMFVSRNLAAKGDLLYDVVHVNSEFSNNGAAALRPSDHDPLLLTLGGVPAPVPEPGTLAMLLTGLGVLGAVGRRRRQTA
jgi:predicted extracellular nuclease